MPDLIKPVPDNYKWGFMVSPFYGVLCLGQVVGDRIDDIRAEVDRLPSGEWLWIIRESPFQGVEPNQKYAIKRVESFIGRYNA